MRFTIGSSTPRTWLVALATGVAASCLAFAAYGSSKGSNTVAVAASTPPAASHQAPPGFARFEAVRECLRKDGVAPPLPPVVPPGASLPPGAPMPPGAQLPPGAPMPPGPPLQPARPPAKAMNGAKRAHVRAALRKCGAPALPPPPCNEAHAHGYPRHGRHRP